MMKKVFVLALIMGCTISMNAAGYRGSRHSGSNSSSSYTHSVGGVVGNMFGASYKGFIFGVEGLALQTDLAVKMQLSPAKSDIKKNSSVKGNSYNWSNYSFELNPNIIYQKDIAQVGRATFAVFGGGGVSLGMASSLNWSSFGIGEKNQLLGKFGINGMAGLEFIWSHFALSLDVRPGYGLAFSNKYKYYSGGNYVTIDVDHYHIHFMDFGASIGMRYCF